MKWSWKLGEFRGIGVYMHATFLILIAFIVLSHWSAGHSLGKTLGRLFRASIEQFDSGSGPNGVELGQTS